MSFGIIAVGGVVIMVLVRGFPVAPRRDETGRLALPGADRLGLAGYVAAIVLYVPDRGAGRARRDRCAAY